MDKPICNCADDVSRTLRGNPPAHYTLKIDSFSGLKAMLSGTGEKCYFSKIFEAIGYKWKLSLYPDGDKERFGDGFISMFLSIEETDDLPIGWEVKVNFKLFIFDHIRGKFLTVQDSSGKVRCFNDFKPEWSFAQFLPLTAFHDAKNGYILNDKCILGAEIFVVSLPSKGESVSPLENVYDGTYTWKINNFSTLADQAHVSDIFSLGDIKWRLKIYPKGDYCVHGKSLSLFLCLEDPNPFYKVYAEFKLRLLDQINFKNIEAQAPLCSWFNAADEDLGYGHKDFVALSDIRNTSRGFLIKDALIVEAEVTRISTVLAHEES